MRTHGRYRMAGVAALAALVVVGRAGSALGAAIGNPNASNGWSTTSAVYVRASSDRWDRPVGAVINGLGMLYSAAREMILNVTARSVHGPMSLPTLNFVGLISNLKGQQLQKGIKAEGPPTDQKPTTPG